MFCVDLAKDMQVVVVLGGQGSRLGPLTDTVPKAMVDVNGKPFFQYMLEMLKKFGFRKFLFCIGRHGQVISRYFGSGSKFDCQIEYSNDGQELLGTAGALRNAVDMLEDDFLLLYGDSFMDIDYNELISRYKWSKENDSKKAIMTILRNSNRYDKSNVLFGDGRILRYDKNNPADDMQHIDYGVSILSKELIRQIPKGRHIDLADIYTKAVDDGVLAGCSVWKRFYEIGTAESLNEFRGFMQSRQRKQKAIILDRDGTLNEIVFNQSTEQLDSPLRPAQFRLITNVAKALNILKSLGYLLIVVTNQPAAAKGKTTLKDLYDVNSWMYELLESRCIVLDDIFMCPHHPLGDRGLCSEQFLICNCPCRKPGSLMIKQAIEKYNIDVPKSFMIGDSVFDVQAGQQEQLKTVFLGQFKCDTCQLLGQSKPSHIFEDLYKFAKFLEVNEQLTLLKI